MLLSYILHYLKSKKNGLTTSSKLFRLSPTTHCKIGRQIRICLACTVLCLSISKWCLHQQQASTQRGECSRRAARRPAGAGGDGGAAESARWVAAELRPPSPRRAPELPSPLLRSLPWISGRPAARRSSSLPPATRCGGEGGRTRRREVAAPGCRGKKVEDVHSSRRRADRSPRRTHLALLAAPAEGSTPHTSFSPRAQPPLSFSCTRLPLSFLWRMPLRSETMQLCISSHLHKQFAFRCLLCWSRHSVCIVASGRQKYLCLLLLDSALDGDVTST
jgi:hypothetical protein